MHKVEPKVFLIGETRLVNDRGVPELGAYLDHIGVGGGPTGDDPEAWSTNAPSDSEELIEVMGRLCYRSWRPGMNANVTRVREGNDKYLRNILDTGHGSVTEHAVLNWIFADVSRVFTHELVRHRVGTAISQESLRFVRLTDLGQWLPAVVRENPEAVAIFEETFGRLEGLQHKLAEIFRLDDEGVPFKVKKILTSAMRRVAPIGLATTIGWSCNFRTLRHVLEMRTGPEVEEEFRLVFEQVGTIAMKRYPNVLADFEVMEVEGHKQFKPANRKV